MEPAPEREQETNWKEFLRQTLGPDRGRRFFHHRSLETMRLQRFVILFFMELSTRKVGIAGIVSSPGGLWMNQISRNLTDVVTVY